MLQVLLLDQKARVWIMWSEIWELQVRHCVWHFIVKDQKMNITGFGLWSSRLSRFSFNAWYLRSENNFEKDVITVQLLFACLYHMKYYTFPFMCRPTASNVRFIVSLFCFSSLYKLKRILFLAPVLMLI